MALIEVPECNVSFAGDNLFKYSRADISVAVSIPGGLITPIVANADGKSVSAIATEIHDLAARAKEGKLQPQEYQGGTASLSNMGMYGIKNFEAVINPPQGMIMAIGAGEKRPYVINDSAADRDGDERDRKLRPPRDRRRRRREADAGVQAAGRKPAGDAGLSVTRKLVNFVIAIVLTAFVCGLMVALPPFVSQTPFGYPEVALGAFFVGG